MRSGVMCSAATMSIRLAISAGINWPKGMTSNFRLVMPAHFSAASSISTSRPSAFCVSGLMEVNGGDGEMPTVIPCLAFS